MTQNSTPTSISLEAGEEYYLIISVLIALVRAEMEIFGMLLMQIILFRC